MGDILSDVLGALELETSLYFRAELSSPYSIAVPENREVIRFHIASRGRCVVHAASGESAEMGPGELILVPHGQSHILSDSSRRAAVPLDRVIDASAFDGEGPLVYGGGGEPSALVCGHFGFSHELTHPFLDTLPSLLHLRAAAGPGYGWMEPMLAFTEHEARERLEGWQGVVERLSQILLVYVLRAHLEREREKAGALGALADPQLAAALACIHGSPATDWTLDALAQKAGMSRSAFVRRFNGACGLSPMRYLTRWRMTRARHLLIHSGASSGEVAAQVGYASEAAFNRAFKEHFDEPPARYRRARLQGSLRGRQPQGGAAGSRFDSDGSPSL